MRFFICLCKHTQLIALYWDIGRLITEKQRASGWGDTVIEQIARDLSRELQTMKGFSRANLWLSPLGFGHFNFLGRYSFNLSEPIAKGNLRPLRDPDKTIT